VAALVVGYLVITITSAIRGEERHLTEKFGSAYTQYREGLAVPPDRQFSFRRVLANREYRAVSGLVLALALLAWKAR
jgi:hypothetical protein